MSLQRSTEECAEQLHLKSLCRRMAWLDKCATNIRASKFASYVHPQLWIVSLQLGHLAQLIQALLTRMMHQCDHAQHTDGNSGGI